MKITVVAAIFKDDSLTLITDKREYYKIQQGDTRLRPILDAVLPVVTKGGTIEVDLSEAAQTNAFEDFEQKSNGVVRFFRIAREKLKTWFGKDSLAVVPEGTYGHVPEEEEEDDKAVEQPVEEKKDQTLQELIAESAPITGLMFNTNTDKDLKPEETLIAVVDNKSVIANAEELHAQVVHANKIGSPQAFENFVRLVAAVPRQHSMEDLVRFIRKLDTPLTEDGYVLAYKNLSTTQDKEVFVDPYTKKVRQGVGTRVCMHESLVDPNRGQDCSNGLHIASRSYLGSYHSNQATFLVRIKPSDVIAVPRYNTNKMRVCAYEILGRLNQEDMRAVCSNQPLRSEEGKKLLAAAVAGVLPPMSHQSEITAQLGGGVKYTNLTETGKESLVDASFEKATFEELGVVDPIDPDVATAVVVAPHVPVEEATAAIEEVKLSRKEVADRLYKSWVQLTVANAPDVDVEAAYNELLDFKKACKVSWDRLDIPADENGPIIVIRVTSEEPVAIKTPNEVAKSFEEATSAVRDSEADASMLDDLFSQFMLTAVDTKQEYELAVKIDTLFKESGFKFDTYGDCPEVSFDEFEYGQVTECISEWELQDLSQKLAPAPEKPAEAVKDEPATDVPAKPKSYREQIRELLQEGPLTIGVAKEIMAIKKSAKKGWSALGVNADEAFDIEQQAKTD